MSKQIELLDVLNVLSFYISVQNLEENLSQGAAGDMLKTAVEDIHVHLKEQDHKIDHILEVLENEKDK